MNDIVQANKAREGGFRIEKAVYNTYNENGCDLLPTASPLTCS